jgi:hypothetical protein
MPNNTYLITELAEAVMLEAFAHFRPELVHVRGRWCELRVSQGGHQCFQGAVGGLGLIRGAALAVRHGWGSVITGFTKSIDLTATEEHGRAEFLLLSIWKAIFVLGGGVNEDGRVLSCLPLVRLDSLVLPLSLCSLSWGQGMIFCFAAFLINRSAFHS